MPRFLVDTDVLIDHLREGVRVPVPPADTAYSTITRAELYAGRDTDERVIDTLLDAFEEIPVDRRIAESAGHIRRMSRLALPAALVAATALAGRRKLVTRNVRHFRSISGLTIHTSKRR